MGKIRNIFVCLLAGLLLFACAKEEDTDPLTPVSVVPSISVNEVSATEIQQFESITLHIAYRDGDADIGTEDPDVHSLKVIDSRGNIEHTFHVQPQSPVPGIAISGVLEVEISNIILLDQNNDSEEFSFQVILSDEAGNESNTAESPLITISK